MIDTTLEQGFQGSPSDAPMQVTLDPSVDEQYNGPVDITIGSDGQVIDGADDQWQDEPQFSDNLAEFISEGELSGLGLELSQLFDEDERSRDDWKKTAADGIEYLGLIHKQRNDPWTNACGCYDPIITEALVRFQSNAIMEVFPNDSGPAKAKILGDVTPDIQDQADRVVDFMNYVITELIPGYRLEKEKQFWALGYSGAVFTKVYWDSVTKRPAAKYILAEDFVMPYGASDLVTSPRYAAIIKPSKNDLRKQQVSGFYRNIDLGEPMQPVEDQLRDKKDKVSREVNMTTRQDFYELVEMHADVDLPGFEDPDGVALPYIVTFERWTHKVLSVYRNWDEHDPAREKKIHISAYHFIPGFGAYGFGLIHLIGSVARGSTSILRQLVDAGTLNNLSGGLKTRTARITQSEVPIRPGEWRDADVLGGKLADAFFPIPTKEPSAVLLQLRQDLVEMGRRMGSIADLDVGDMSSQAPVGTTLAILERSLKIMSAVQARIHTSLSDEFKILKRVIEENMPESGEYPYQVHGKDRSIKADDFRGVGVVPVSNPNSATMAERVLQYQAATQLAQQYPEGYDMPALHRAFLRILGIKDADQIVPDKSKLPLLDMESENQALVMGQPVKVFEEQNHQAHIAGHTAFVKNPDVGQLLGQNPAAQARYAAFQSHITEHLGFQHRMEVEQALGVPLPPAGQPLPAELESPLSLSIAEASQRVLQTAQQKAQQQQAQQQAQDPVLQMQQKDLEIKASAVQQKQQSAQLSAQTKLQAEQMQQETERMRIASQHNLGTGAQQQRGVSDHQNFQLEIHRMGVEMRKLQQELMRLQAQVAGGPGNGPGPGDLNLG